MEVAQQAKGSAHAQTGLREAVDRFCQRAILVVIALILVWGPLAFGALPESDFLEIQGLTVLALGLWAVRVHAQRPFRLFWPPICWGVVVFLLYALARCQLVILHYPARHELAQVIVYGSIFFIVLNNLNSRESANVITLCLIALGTGLAVFAIYQFATHHPSSVWGVPRREQYISRGSATYLNPNHLVGFLEMVLPLALAYAIMSRFSATLKVLFAYCALVMAGGIVVSVSRGGILAAFVMLVAFCLGLLGQRGFRFVGAALAACLVISGIVFAADFEPIHKRMDDALTYGDFRDARSHYWFAAEKIFERHILWGAGPGHFDAEYPPFRFPPDQSRPVFAHNDYLNTLADWGAVGMAIIAATCFLLFFGMRNAWAATRKTAEDLISSLSDKRAFLFGASMGLLAILIHSVVDFNMHIPANAVLAITLMALISAQERFATERFWRNPRRTGKALLTGVTVAAMVCVTAQGVGTGKEMYWLWRAAKETQSWQANLNALQKAYAAAPDNDETAYSLGEYYRQASLEGNPGYEGQARQAMEWYAKSMAINPFTYLPVVGYGQCLDWLGEKDQATPYFVRAEKLDPTNCYLAVYEGRHYVELGDYQTAKRYFERSYGLYGNDMARQYLEMINRRLADTSGIFKK